MSRFSVDVPNGNNPAAEWVNMGYAETREEAISAAQELFGADEEGRIQLVSEIPPRWLPVARRRTAARRQEDNPEDNDE